MKRMTKRLICMLMIFALLASLLTIRAGAALPPQLCGDVNFDNSVDVVDATLIQRFMAGLTDFYYNQQVVADFDRDGEVSIIDVTWIMRQEAMMNVPVWFGGWLDQHIVVTSFFADHDSGKAAVGEPVTFTASANNDYDYCTYEFFVDGEMVRERSYRNTFTYTFEESGDHSVGVRAYNADGFRTSIQPIWNYYHDYPDDTTAHPVDYPRVRAYQVVDSYPHDKLSLLAVNAIDFEYSNTPSVKANAIGGEGYHAYIFMITDPDVDDQHTEEFFRQFGWELYYDEHEQPFLYRYSYTGFAEISLDMFDRNHYCQHEITVQAEDARGHLSEIERLYLASEVRIG